MSELPKKAQKKRTISDSVAQDPPDGFTPGEEHAPYRFGKSSIHGIGVFAHRRIESGAYIGEYKGPRTTTDGMHVMWVYDEDGENEEARDGKNGLRYLNQSPTPNAEFDGFELFALRDIEVGEEICFDYGNPDLDFDEEPGAG